MNLLGFGKIFRVFPANEEKFKVNLLSLRRQSFLEFGLELFKLYRNEKFTLSMCQYFEADDWNNLFNYEPVQELKPAGYDSFIEQMKELCFEHYFCAHINHLCDALNKSKSTFKEIVVHAQTERLKLKSISENFNSETHRFKRLLKSLDSR